MAGAPLRELPTPPSSTMASNHHRYTWPRTMAAFPDVFLVFVTDALVASRRDLPYLVPGTAN